jgi:hypothetical protein
LGYPVVPYAQDSVIVKLKQRVVIPAFDGFNVLKERLMGQKRWLLDDISNRNTFAELAFAVAAEHPKVMYHLERCADKVTQSTKPLLHLPVKENAAMQDYDSVTGVSDLKRNV